MEIVLLERIRHLGQMGDVVDVKKGYARNFLLPQGKALRSTPANRERFERERATIEARDLELRTEAEHAAEKISGLQIDVIRQASEAGTLYGSVSSRDIAVACREQAVSVERRQIELERPIKTLGMHAVQVVLHPEVTVPMIVCVARSQEEAQLQARGGVAASPAAGELEQQPDADPRVTAEHQPDATDESSTTASGAEPVATTPDPTETESTTAPAESTTATPAAETAPTSTPDAQPETATGTAADTATVPVTVTQPEPAVPVTAEAGSAAIEEDDAKGEAG